ncbi:MAG: preprotein translocase subunit SecE [candidate division SR1 bacterium]|nr:preprotein translocase subunit SecE [candidate division SR1 bacterium]
MMKFIYDSLETVKKLKHPTKKDFINLTIAILVAIVVAGTYFILADTIFSGIYKRFYSMMMK